jgi:hypothetical protein
MPSGIMPSVVMTSVVALLLWVNLFCPFECVLSKYPSNSLTPLETGQILYLDGASVS